MRIERETAGPQGPPFQPGDVVYLPGTDADLYLVGVGCRDGSYEQTERWTRLRNGQVCSPGASGSWRKVPPGTRVVLEL